MSNVQRIAPAARSPVIAFHRIEMGPILDIYGRMVATGEAKDYAIGMHADRAIFAIFKRTAEQPSWRIEKVPALSRKQGQYVVYGSAGQVLKRGQDLRSVLRVFDRKKFVVVD